VLRHLERYNKRDMKKDEKNKISPELPSGFRDYLPEDMIPRQEMIDKIRKVFELFGFDPLDTPIIERLDVLTGKSESFKMNLFRTGIVPGLQKPNASSFEEMALRFDLTVPLARVVAANQTLPKPFKRYQIGYVFRGERPQKGRYRGFLQFDADIVGSSSMLADTEIIQLMQKTMLALGIENFVIRINNRKVLDGLAELANFSTPAERKKEVFRILDKLEKIGWEKVAEELKRKPDNEYDISAPNLKEKDIETIKNFLEIQGKNDEVLQKLNELFKNIPSGKEGIKELEEISSNLKGLEVPERYWKIDLSIARGLDYYTGPVFETTLSDIPEIGSVFSGGRYDGLVSNFSDMKIPATGASVGVDRLFAALESLGKISKQKTKTKVLITFFDKELQKDYLKLSKLLREEGISTEIYMGDEKAFKAQLAYALKKEIPIVLIIGKDEKEKGVISVKNLREKTQEEVKESEIANRIKKLILS
jgi:histidyl-tRNA synthetase